MRQERTRSVEMSHPRGKETVAAPPRRQPMPFRIPLLPAARLPAAVLPAILPALLVLCAPRPAPGAEAPLRRPATLPTADELIEAGRWAKAKLAGVSDPSPLAPGLTVLSNNDRPQKGGKLGKPLRLGGKSYARGIFAHAPSAILVRLPGPGSAFSTTVGVDSNEQTSGGRGSVVFSVLLGERAAFRSDVLREGMKPVELEVDLEGASEFTLGVEDAGDGIACDQAAWAEARVVLRDGSELRLDDLPLLDLRRGAPSADPPFSFSYGGKPFAEIAESWEVERSSTEIDPRRTALRTAYRDPATGLEVRCDAVEYRDFPAVEWTLHLANRGLKETPLIEDIRPLDLLIRRGGVGGFILHHAVGSPANGTDYGPLETPLGANATKRISAAGGRPTNSDLSFFNLDYSGEGAIVSVGWPGQWAADFSRDGGDGLRIRAGQELTRFKLLPDEEVRSPSIALLFWQGDRMRSQNLWRRWMVAHVLPRPGGKLPPPMLPASSSRAYEEMIGANEENQKLHIDRWLEEGIRLDFWWMDAGWYVQKTGWPNVGTWEIDRARFPRGFKPVSDHAHARGLKILVWFEPERVTAGTWLAEKHPEWVLGGSAGGLLDLGNRAAREWLTEHVDRLLVEEGIDLYRQDFNMDPLGHWRAADPPDRQGIAEIGHVTGLLAYWDELIRRHPDILIDTCASGGRRNDLETLRRAVPLWRSDYAYEAVGHQCMTWGISLWIPYHGTGTVATASAPYYGGGYTAVEPYAFWSNAAPSLGLGIDVRVKEIDYAALRRLVEAWRRLAPNYYGDFWPLSPYTRDRAAWIAWQFDRPEEGEGMVQAFRRDGSIYEAARLPLRGLDPTAWYEVTTIEGAAGIAGAAGTAGSSEKMERRGGAELLEAGLPVAIPTRPGAAVFAYRRVER